MVIFLITIYSLISEKPVQFASLSTSVNKLRIPPTNPDRVSENKPLLYFSVALKRIIMMGNFRNAATQGK